jgi:protein-tyrosine phosphatase
MSAPLRILFVCTGNLCRSPLAQAICTAEARRLGLADRIRVESAGTHAREGAGCPPLLQELAAGQGLDLAGHRARRLRESDFFEQDLLVALDLGHLDHLNFMRPAAASARQMLLLSGVDEAGTIEVPDPFGRSARAYAHAGELVRVGVMRLLARLAESGAPGPVNVPGT